VDLERYIRDVKDFPKKGIVFKDITPLLASAAAMRETVLRLVAPFADADIDIVAAVESRGFIFGAMAADFLGAGFVPIRKPGKLPSKTISASYELEYGTDTIEMHADAVHDGQKVLMIDDLLATGGTMGAACGVVEKAGGVVVGISFVIELCFLNGRDKLPGRNIHTLIAVEGE
jgi:adenine phosphoribosyltransferase